MTRSELIKKLQAMGVHESSYSFGVLRNSECVSLINEDDQWKVYYVERDMPDELGVFASEAEANDYIFYKFKEWHGLA